MTSIDPLDEDKPLDPEVEEIRRKMVRLLAISISIMVVGLVAVFGAILYKVKQPSTKDASTQSAANPALKTNKTDIKLPKDALLVSSTLNGNRILLTIELADKSRQLLVYDIDAEGIIATLNIGQ